MNRETVSQASGRVSGNKKYSMNRVELIRTRRGGKAKLSRRSSQELRSCDGHVIVNGQPQLEMTNALIC
jgi:hypothetical protein